MGCADVILAPMAVRAAAFACVSACSSVCSGVHLRRVVCLRLLGEIEPAEIGRVHQLSQALARGEGGLAGEHALVHRLARRVLLGVVHVGAVLPQVGLLRLHVLDVLAQARVDAGEGGVESVRVVLRWARSWASVWLIIGSRGLGGLTAGLRCTQASRSCIALRHWMNNSAGL